MASHTVPRIDIHREVHSTTAEPNTAAMNTTTEISRPTFFTSESLCARWGVTVQTLFRWRREGKLRATKLGSGVRYSREEVQRFETEGASTH